MKTGIVLMGKVRSGRCVHVTMFSTKWLLTLGASWLG